MWGRIFGDVFLASWRMVIALLLGLLLYVYVFVNHDGVYNSIHGACNAVASWFFDLIGAYAKWKNLLQIGDKLVFMVFIVVGRIIWLLFEFGILRRFVDMSGKKGKSAA